MPKFLRPLWKRFCELAAIKLAKQRELTAKELEEWNAIAADLETHWAALR